MVNQIVNNFSFKKEKIWMHRQNNSGYLFEVTSICTGMSKDKIHESIFGPAHEMWLLIDKCVNASLYAHAYVPSGTRSRPIIYASSEGSGKTVHYKYPQHLSTKYVLIEK